MNMKQSILLSLVLISALGCNQDEPAQQLTLPTNLLLNVEVITDGLGQVSVTATATNANYYTLFFGDAVAETGLKTLDGKAVHTYSAAGDFTITAKAHVTQADFISTTESITISLEAGIPIPANGATSPLTYSGKTLVWQDEFSGTALNTSFWKYDLGTNNGWGNNELQFYRQENTEVRDGYLVITAKKEAFQGSQYTSSRIITSGLKSFKYGRIDIRAALPKGQGIWPALWMLGSSFQTIGWPKCGEIDIMEMIGGQGRENTVHGTVHWDNNGSYASYTDSKTLSSGILGDEFHVYSIVWTNTSIIWYLDNVQYNIIDITPGDLSEFQQEFFFLFNVAVGGNWPGNPDGSTVFPQHLIVDYVRVFQ